MTNQITKAAPSDKTGMMFRARQAVDLPEVQAIIQQLGKHGLGVFIPHAHTSDGFVPLPRDVISMESDLKVSFVTTDDPILDDATVVGWVWDSHAARVAAACACRGNHFPGNCSSKVHSEAHGKNS